MEFNSINFKADYEHMQEYRNPLKRNVLHFVIELYNDIVVRFRNRGDLR